MKNYEKGFVYNSLNSNKRYLILDNNFCHKIRSSLKHTNSTCSGHRRPNVFRRRHKAQALFIDRRCLSYNEHNDPKITNRFKLWNDLIKQTNDTNLSHESIISKRISSPETRSRNTSDGEGRKHDEIFAIAKLAQNSIFQT